MNPKTDALAAPRAKVNDDGTVEAAEATDVNLDCFTFCGNRWPSGSGICSFNDCDDPDSTEEFGGDNVNVFSSEPIVIGLIIEFEGTPNPVELRAEVEWINERTGESIVEDTFTLQDELSGDRYFKWYSWAFSLDPGTDNIGDPVSVEILIEEEISGQTAFLNTELEGELAKVEAEREADISAITINNQQVL